MASLDAPQPRPLVQPNNNADALAEQMEKGYKYSRVYIDFLPLDATVQDPFRRYVGGFKHARVVVADGIHGPVVNEYAKEWVPVTVRKYPDLPTRLDLLEPDKPLFDPTSKLPNFMPADGPTTETWGYTYQGSKTLVMAANQCVPERGLRPQRYVEGSKQRFLGYTFLTTAEINAKANEIFSGRYQRVGYNVVTNSCWNNAFVLCDEIVDRKILPDVPRVGLADFMHYVHRCEIPPVPIAPDGEGYVLNV